MKLNKKIPKFEFQKLSNETPHELVANEDKSDKISIESKAEKANDALNDSTTQATEIDDIPKVMLLSCYHIKFWFKFFFCYI